MSDKPTTDATNAMRRAFKVIETLEAKVKVLEAARNEPIAVIGLACRFPGADTPEELWQVLVEGRDTIGEVPADRGGDWQGHKGGFIQGADHFDAGFWGISGREAASMDPQQRLVLEVCHDALERAGQSAEMVRRSPTGIFLAISSSDYAFMTATVSDSDAFHFATGNGKSFTCGRVSYALELSGPSIAIDTACSSSLVAVDLACQSLRVRTSDMAIATGVTLNLSPFLSAAYAKSGVTSPTFHCKTFDAAADGYARSEGCGAVVLKRLSDAQADGDRILAVVRGAAVNQNGGSASIKAPNPVARVAVLRQALAQARVSPSQVSFVEAHGSGTALGDAIEVQALKEVLGAPTREAGPCLLASIKTNIGHLETASGIAGMIKTVLALDKGFIPPHRNFKRLSPNISFDGTRFEIPLTGRPWARGDTPRIAGVSAFGMRGTNAHVVLEEAPKPADEPVLPDEPRVLTISAKSEAALRVAADRYAQRLTGVPDSELGRVCFTTNVRRSHHEFRLALVARAARQASEDLAAFARGERRPGVRSGQVAPSRRKLAFAFPGHAPLAADVARALAEVEPDFRAALAECDAALVQAGAPSVLAELASGSADGEAAGIHGVFALQVALASLWRAWGVEPQAVIGEGVGEIAAAHVAGALPLDQAARIVCARGALAGATGKGNGAGTGGHGRAGGIPRRVAEEAMAPARLRLSPAATRIPIYSTVTAQLVGGETLDAAYWARNASERPTLGPALEGLVAEGYEVFLEVSPKPVLASFIDAAVARLGKPGGFVPTVDGDGGAREAMLDAMARLHTLGCRVDWARRYPRGLRPIDLPTYPWQRERYWNEGIVDRAGPAATPSGAPPSSDRRIPGQAPA